MNFLCTTAACTLKSPIIRASLWMLVALSSFALMAVAGKELAENIGIAEILFFRSLIGLLVLSIVVSIVGIESIKSTSIKKHIARNTSHFIGQYGWFYGIAFIPLAEVFALEFTVPIWTAIAATILSNEAITKIRAVSIALGIFGVLIILRPTVEIIHPAAMVVIVGAMAYGLAHTLTRSIVKHDSPLSVLFYMCLIQFPVGLLLAFGDWVMPVGIMWFWLLVVGVTALSAHYGMSKALSHADAMVVVPMDFFRLPLIMLVGWYFYNEPIEGLLLLGTSIMLVGNYLNIKHEHIKANT